MTLNDLNTTLAEAVASGKIGTPVSLRLHLQVSSPASDPIDLLAALLPLAETGLAAKPSRLTARRNEQAHQLNVLFEYAGGQTMLITCGTGCTERDSLHLLLLGNRGVIRLEGGDLSEPESVPSGRAAQFWRTQIEASTRNQAAVSLDID